MEIVVLVIDLSFTRKTLIGKIANSPIVLTERNYTYA